MIYWITVFVEKSLALPGLLNSLAPIDTLQSSRLRPSNREIKKSWVPGFSGTLEKLHIGSHNPGET